MLAPRSTGILAPAFVPGSDADSGSRAPRLPGRLIVAHLRGDVRAMRNGDFEAPSLA